MYAAAVELLTYIGQQIDNTTSIAEAVATMRALIIF